MVVKVEVGVIGSKFSSNVTMEDYTLEELSLALVLTEIKRNDLLKEIESKTARIERDSHKK